MTAIDTTVGLTAAQLAALRAAGVTAVSRYIAPQVWKRITPTEAAWYAPAGVQLVLNWESGAQDLVNLSQADTETYARQAVVQAQACGYPAGCVIYVSADWNVAAGQWGTVARNLRAIRSIYRAAGYGLGLYGPWDALAWAKRDGLVDAYWQAGMSTSWSGGRNASAWPGAHLRQRRATFVAGVDCDVNDILIASFGQAGQPGAAPAVTTQGDDMGVIARDDKTGQEYWCTGGFSHPIASPEQANAIRALAVEGVIQLASRPASDPNWMDGGTTRTGWTPEVFGPVWTGSGAAPVIDQDALNTAVKAALSDASVLAGLAKAVNDDAAARLAQ